MYHLAQSEESGRKPDFALGEDGTVRVVAELGYTQTPASLSAAVHWWLESSGTTVELVITIRMRQATHGLEVTAWELRSRASTSTRRRNPITAIQCRQLARSPEPTIDQATGIHTPVNQAILLFHTVSHMMPNSMGTGVVVRTPGILSQNLDWILMHALHQMKLTCSSVETLRILMVNGE